MGGGHSYIYIERCQIAGRHAQYICALQQEHHKVHLIYDCCLVIPPTGGRIEAGMFIEYNRAAKNLTDSLNSTGYIHLISFVFFGLHVSTSMALMDTLVISY